MFEPEGRREFAQFLKPRLMELLSAIGLDVVYERGERDSLWFKDDRGEPVEVLDLLGGYGASLLGHNNPELVARARRVLDEQRPLNAQASARGKAGLLGKKLSELVGKSTGREYVVTLANSGAEAVEAAIKHAEIEMAERINGILERLKRTRKELRRRLRDHTASVPESIYSRAARFFDEPRIEDLDELFLRLFRYNVDQLYREPAFFAIESAFHGKSTGSLKLTNNPVYRSPWKRIGLRSVFLPHGDVDAIAREVERMRVRYLDAWLTEGGELAVEERTLTNVSACFVEPIQGEGGIRELETSYFQALRKHADQGGFPLVIDEIQSGLGRTGALLASEQARVRGDYYLFSKALGGGLAKVSALLVDRERYCAEYGYLHTSTFAEDDYSSSIALGVLEIIERDRIPERCQERGAKLIARLNELRAKYPDELRAVRGRGLMVGLELGRELRNRSPLVRLLAEQNLLGFVASGWLLHEERVRVAPTLSAHGTIRIEPSAYLEDGAIERAGEALERLLGAIQRGDSYRLARYLVGRARESAPPETPRVERPEPAHLRRGYAPAPYAHKVAFLGHFLEPGDLRGWDPALAPFTDAECQTFLEKTKGLLEPFIVERAELRAIGGEVVNVTVIGLAFTAAQASAALRASDTAWLVAEVEKAVALAKRLGCSIVGFGGYVSIVTDNCRAIEEDEMGLTSGNSLTAVAALEALESAANRLRIEKRRLGVLGAAGNIGAVLAEVAGDHTDDVLLVGRPGATKRLEKVAAEVYFGAWKRLFRQGAKDGLAGRIASTCTVRRLIDEQARGVDRVGEAIRVGLIAELGAAHVPVRVTEDMNDLRSCNLIVTATNAARPIVLPEHVGPGPVVVCDVAQPRDVDVRVSEREDVVVLKGGLVRAPLGQELDVGGMKLEGGQLYGCLAETVLLGFAGSGENFSYGRLTGGHLRRIRELARLHGFTVEELRA